MINRFSRRPYMAILLVQALSFIAGACRTNDGSDVERVRYQDPKPEEGQTITEARVLSLNQWAKDLLGASKDIDDFQRLADDYFAKIGVTDADKLSSYTLSLRPGSECFHDGRDHKDIWWNDHRDQIRAQVESAAQFIFEFHKAMVGKNVGPFSIRELEICPQSVVKRELNLVGQKLVIGVPFNSVRGGYQVITSDQLLQRWRRGDHLVEEKKAFTNVFTRNKLTKIWMIFDPIGTLRNGLRQSIASNGQTVLRRLDTVGPNPELGNLKNGVIDTVVDKKRLKIATDANLDKLAQQGRLPLMLENWRCLVASLRMADDLSLGAIGTLDKAMRQDKNKVNVDIKAGLVAVGNYHQIGVTFGVADGVYSEYLEKPEVNSSDNEINVKVQAGLVSVFTIDDVKVDVAINLAKLMANRSLETASFDVAVQAALSNQNICKK